MGALPSPAVLAGAADDKSLPALSFGACVPTHGYAGVHSIFERAVNLEIAGQRLVVLLDPQCPNVPHGIRLTARAWRALRAWLRVGDAADLEPSLLRFARGNVTVDLSHATRWHVALTRTQVHWGDVRVVRAFEAARAASQTVRTRADDSVAALYSRRLARVLPLLNAALGQLRADAASEQLQRLLGLGPGLTPSGDDFIVGCLAGLAVGTQNERERIQFLAAITASLELDATTPISRQHLSDACDLQFAQPLAELCIAIATGAADVPATLDAALAVGAHSGADGVAGLLFALDAWRAPDRLAPCPLPNPPPRAESAHPHPTLSRRERELISARKGGGNNEGRRHAFWRAH